jgi:ArsR family transcriptional regulator
MQDPAHLFKCLSEPTRLYATLLIQQEGELCVCELMAALNDSQPKISRHLAQLRNGGILDDVRRSQWVFYSLAKDLPDWVTSVLRTTRDSHVGLLNTLTQNLHAMQQRPMCC